jgi:hypothetical protein
MSARLLLFLPELGTGTVPLEILDRQMDAYIKVAGGRF